ncbi:UDP-glucuronosyltransferase 2C1-like [Diadema setosum]|uniref:UDP-glucuronosyltransferase 2C1-like n=1 Tax=Diadema setosum TaxID=31175 RepID=UPI003B3A44E6
MMNANRYILVCLFCFLGGCLNSEVYAANVLISAIYGEGSHFLSAASIGLALTQRGHNVTCLISNAYAHHTRDPKYASFVFEVFEHREPPENVRKAFFDLNKYAFQKETSGQFLEIQKHMARRTVDDCESVISNKDILSKFLSVDVLLMDVSWPCGLYIKAMLDKERSESKEVRMVALISTPPWSGFLQASGSSFNWAYQPETMSTFSNRMDFWQRMSNVFHSSVIKMILRYVATPPYFQMERNVGLDININPWLDYAHFDLFLLNVDFSSEFPIPLSPSTIAVGGLTTRPSAVLEPELEEFVQSSGEHGVVVFSLGTYLASITVIRPDLVRMFSDAFAKLPQKVIWQLKELPDYDLPPNVKTMPWLPQNDLLGHPKTRAFMYQGGNNGFQEASYHGVPVVVIPLHGDQYDVAARIEARGMGKKIDKQDLSTEIIYETLTEVINNPSYTTVAKKVSAINKDQPMRAPERAAFWIEHVIKFGGDYMRSPANELNFFQYHLIDVIAFLIVVFVAILLVLFFTLRFCLRLCCRMIGWGGTTKTKKD